MSLVRRFAATYSEGGLPFLMRRMAEHILFESPIKSSKIKNTYWKYAPEYYKNIRRDVHDFSNPPNAFKIELVDPSDITRFSSRPYPQWKFTARKFGEVQSGNWDLKTEIPVRKDNDVTAPDIYLGDTFEDTILYKSLHNHFVNSVSWKQTMLVKYAKKRVSKEKTAWGGCESIQDIEGKCESIDSVYKKIAQEGYSTQCDLLQRSARPVTGFPDLIADEVLIDIGRSGELLFVDGRHRLSIAKILNLKQIPVAFLVRHRKWMELREKLAHQKKIPDHPDLRDIKR